MRKESIEDVINSVKPVVCLYDLEKEVEKIPDVIYIDTEAMGLLVNRDRLCAVQLFFETEGKKYMYVVHYPKSNYKSPNLVKLLNSKAIKVFHYARQDMLMIYRYLGVLLKNVHCTKIMSKIARTYTDRHSFKDLVRELLKINVDKTEQCSYWGTNELSHSQVHYAAKDALYLPYLYKSLKNILDREGREDLAEKACKCLQSIVLLEESNYDPLKIFDHF